MTEEASYPTLDNRPLEIEAWGKIDSMPKLIEALAKAQLEFAAVVKNAENPAFKRGNKISKYADLSGYIDATRPALSKNGLVVVQLAMTQDGRVGVTTLLLHSGGAGLKGVLWIPVAQFTAHGIGGGLTYARRYSYAAILSLGTEDDDGNTATGKEHTDEQAEETTGRITAIVADIMAQAPDKSPDVQGMWYRLKEPVTGREVDLFAADVAKDSGLLFSKIGYRVVLKAIPENTSKDCTRFELQTVVGVTKPEPPSGPQEALKTNPGADKSQRKQNPNATITEKQLGRMWAIAKSAGFDEQQVRNLAGSHGWEGHLKEMTAGIYDKVCTDLQTYVTDKDTGSL